MYIKSKMNNCIYYLKENAISGLKNYNYFKKSVTNCFEINIAAPLFEGTVVNDYVSNETISKHVINCLESAIVPAPLLVKIVLANSVNIEKILTTKNQKERDDTVRETALNITASTAINYAQQHFNDSTFKSACAASVGIAATCANLSITWK